jgi:hypothetical protein
MLANIWRENEYHLDVCCATNDAHIERPSYLEPLSTLETLWGPQEHRTKVTHSSNCLLYLMHDNTAVYIHIH